MDICHMVWWQVCVTSLLSHLTVVHVCMYIRWTYVYRLCDLLDACSVVMLTSFADDLVLLADNPIDFQVALDLLQDYIFNGPFLLIRTKPLCLEITIFSFMWTCNGTMDGTYGICSPTMPPKKHFESYIYSHSLYMRIYILLHRTED